MGRLKILAKEHASQSHGDLFEKVMADILNYYGYRIEQIHRTDETGLKVNVTGKHIDTQRPFYAECKGNQTTVSVSEIQAFYGKYMVKWHENKACHGLLIAVSGLDKDAGEFYRRHIASNPKVTTRLYEQEAIIRAVVDNPGFADPSVISRSIPSKLGRSGNQLLLCTPQGFFWVQSVIRLDSGTTSSVALFDAKGQPISDNAVFEYLKDLYPVLDDYEDITISSTAALQAELFQDTEEIVELTGSPDFFGYQFPASPEHFVGRDPYLKKLDSFSDKVLRKQTSSRVILIDAPSGLGKSSLVLAGVTRFKAMGHFAVAFDMHRVASPTYVPKSLDYLLRRFGDFEGCITPEDVPKSSIELEDALYAILKIGRMLEKHNKLIFIFFDHFENVFRRYELFESFKTMLLKVSDAQTNLILGFTCRLDSDSSTQTVYNNFWKQFIKPTLPIVLDTFSEVEIKAFIAKLKTILGEALSKDLRFHLSEFSQGNPRRFKRLCAQIIALRKAGVAKADINVRLLNREVLAPADNHLLLAKAGDVYKAAVIIKKAGSYLDMSKIRARAGLTEKSFFYVARDMYLLGLAQVDHNKIILEVDFPKAPQYFEEAWRQGLRTRLQSNRLVRHYLELLEEKGSLTLEEMSRVLAAGCPYLSLSQKTWITYARIFAQWLNAADLALLDSSNMLMVTRYNPDTEIRERYLILPRRHGTKTPQIQYSPIEDIAIKLRQALRKDGQVDWTGLKKSTIFRALAALEDFGFIQRRTQLIRVLPKCFEFVSNPNKRPDLFAEGALKLESFAEFIKILQRYKEKGQTLLALGLELSEKLSVSWKESTAENIAKILLDWARHTNLAPGVFAHTRRGPLKGWKKKQDLQIPLF